MRKVKRTFQNLFHSKTLAVTVYLFLGLFCRCGILIENAEKFSLYI